MVQHKRWFVTSSSRGFGRIWTEAALARGDKVAATALGDLVETYGNAILPFSLDVTDRNAVFAAVEDAHAHFGRLHVILYNAGYGYMGAVEEVVEADAHYELRHKRVRHVVRYPDRVADIPRTAQLAHPHGFQHWGVVGFPTGGFMQRQNLPSRECPKPFRAKWRAST
jgi:NAD(P)-dependent dehydrogenase (short-subunit alcohol dehydrogenase family)